MNAFEAPDPGNYDRVVSVEMFEHMKNYRKLMGKVAEWLKPGGKLFVHIFTHRDHAYHYEVKDDSDWMAKYFFTGGQMPSDHLLLNYQDQLKIQEHWRVDGTHYEKTSNAWLENMDRNSHEILPLLEETYGAHQDHQMGGSTGAASTWLAQSFGDTTAGASGSYRTTSSRNRNSDRGDLFEIRTTPIIVGAA